MPQACDADISAAIDEALTSSAVLDLDDLVAAVVTSGLELGEDPAARVHAVLALREDDELRRLAEDHDLHDDEARAVADLVAHFLDEAASGRTDSLDAQEPWVKDLLVLATPAVAEAAQVELFNAWTHARHEPFDFLERVAAAVPRTARPNVWWIRAKAHERLSQTLAAEAALEAAQTLDPDCWLALFDLARYAADRGQAQRALTLLRRAQVPADDAHMSLLTQFLPRESALGRNDVCWCGSGRKYKACHLGKEQLSLLQRAPWLFHKAGVFLNTEDWRAASIELATSLLGEDAGLDDLADAALSPMVVNSLLFEDGALAAFVEERGMLLPEDELVTAQEWLSASRSVYRIVGTGEDAIAVRDLRTQQEFVVWDPHAAQHLPIDLVMCARFLPVGQGFIGFGAYEPVGDQEVERFLDALEHIDNAADWLAFVAQRRAEDASTQ